MNPILGVAGVLGVFGSLKLNDYKDYCKFCKMLKNKYLSILNNISQEIPVFDNDASIMKTLKINETENFDYIPNVIFSDNDDYSENIELGEISLSSSNQSLEEYLKPKWNYLTFKSFYFLQNGNLNYSQIQQVLNNIDINSIYNFKLKLSLEINKLKRFENNISDFKNYRKLNIELNNELDEIIENITKVINFLSFLHFTFNEINEIYNLNNNYNFKLKISRNNYSRDINIWVSALSPISKNLNSLSFDKIIDLKDVLTDDLNLLHLSSERLENKYIKIKNILKEKTKYLHQSGITNLFFNNIEYINTSFSQEFKNEISKLNHKNLVTDNLINSCYSYINYAIVTTLLKLELETILIKTAIIKGNAFNNQLTKIIDTLNNFNRNSIQLENHPSQWLSFFTNEKFKKSHSEYISDFNSLYETLESGGSNNNDNVTILKKSNIMTLIYITKNSNSISISVSKIKILDIITELINNIFNKNCDIYLSHLFNMIFAERSRTGYTVFKLKDIEEVTAEKEKNFQKFYNGLIETIKNKNENLEELWINSKMTLFQFLFFDENKKFDEDLLEYFVKLVYSYNNNFSLELLLERKNEYLFEKLKNRFFDFIQDEINRQYIYCMQSMEMFHREMQEKTDEFNRQMASYFSKAPSFGNFGPRESYSMFRAHRGQSARESQGSFISSRHSSVMNSTNVSSPNPASTSYLLEGSKPENLRGNYLSNKTNNNLKSLFNLKVNKNFKINKDSKLLKGIKPIKTNNNFFQPEINFGGTECIIVTTNVLSQELNLSGETVSCKKIGLSNNFFNSLKPYMKASTIVAKKVKVSANINEVNMVENFPTPPETPKDFEILKGSLEERLINLQLPSPPNHKIQIQNNFCSLTLTNDKDNFIKIINKKINNYVYKDFEIINKDPFIINSIYSDYFGVINKYQYLLLNLNNNYIFYLGSTITISMYIIEFLITILIAIGIGMLFKKVFFKIFNYLPNNIQLILNPYINIIQSLFSLYFDCILLLLLYKGLVYFDTWLISRIFFILYIKYYKKLSYINDKINHINDNINTSFLIFYKKNVILYTFSNNPKSYTNMFNIGLE